MPWFPLSRSIFVDIQQSQDLDQRVSCTGLVSRNTSPVALPKQPFDEPGSDVLARIRQSRRLDSRRAFSQRSVSYMVITRKWMSGSMIVDDSRFIFLDESGLFINITLS